MSYVKGSSNGRKGNINTSLASFIFMIVDASDTRECTISPTYLLGLSEHVPHSIKSQMRNVFGMMNTWVNRIAYLCTVTVIDSIDWQNLPIA